MGDAEPVDQKKYLEDSSKPKCVRPLIEYQGVNMHVDVYIEGLEEVLKKYSFGRSRVSLEYAACIKRVEGDETGEKHCTGQYFDYWHCIDRAVAPKLFDKLK